MKTIVVANQKGGVGKTTVARHLAFYGMAKGLRVLAVDMDVQGNFSTTFRNMAQEAGHPWPSSLAHALVTSGLFASNGHRLNSPLAAMPIQCSQHAWCIPADPGIVDIERSDLATAIAQGQARFKQLCPHFDVCVVDTGPAVSHLLMVALSIGDYAISPCKPDRDAIAGLAGFFSNVLRVRDTMGINPHLAPLGILPNQVAVKRAYHRDVLQSMYTEWGDSVLPVLLHERAAIDLAKDKPVWHTQRGESRSLAAQEMKAACACIYQGMGLALAPVPPPPSKPKH